MTGLGRERPNSETRRSPNIPNSAPELMSESPGNLLVEFCKGHTSNSHDNSADFRGGDAMSHRDWI